MPIAVDVGQQDRTDTSPEQDRWKHFMPKRTNGRVPTEADVTAYLRAAKDADLRQKVLGELRDRSQLGPGLFLQLLGAGTAMFAILAATASSVISSIAASDSDTAFGFSLVFYVVIVTATVIFFVVCFLSAIVRQLKSRVAAVWLAAYEEAERRPWWKRSRGGMKVNTAS
ncbi:MULTISPECIES: hypothetical protein [unclassified Curtobacterium]|uniref:hypothetical protein n=2 Tax=Microbacteriaceae TaxID=85023 RepID=UPI00160FC4AC|nr:MULTISPECIES: hypothetical protein [unclassified Curtobacterium]